MCVCRCACVRLWVVTGAWVVDMSARARAVRLCARLRAQCVRSWVSKNRLQSSSTRCCDLAGSPFNSSSPRSCPPSHTDRPRCPYQDSPFYRELVTAFGTSVYDVAKYVTVSTAARTVRPSPY